MRKTMTPLLTTALLLTATPALADTVAFRCDARGADTCFFSYHVGAGFSNFTLAPGRTYVFNGGKIGDTYIVFAGRQAPVNWPMCPASVGCTPKTVHAGWND